MKNRLCRELVTLDRRRRVSMAKIGRPEHTRYAVTVDDDGTIVMTPVDIVALPRGDVS